MRGRRLLGPAGGACIFCVISALVIGGLAWVTFAALDVEREQRLATARADSLHKERLALWQLDGRLFPSLGVENSRPTTHYFTLSPVPVVNAAGDRTGAMNCIPSPLLTADLPEWMQLHFQLDPEIGWESPQVMPPQLENKLIAPMPPAETDVNVGRRAALAELKTNFPAPTLYQYFEQVNNDPDAAPTLVLPKLDATTPRPSSPGVAPTPLDAKATESFRKAVAEGGPLNRGVSQGSPSYINGRGGNARAVLNNENSFDARNHAIQRGMEDTVLANGGIMPPPVVGPPVEIPPLHPGNGPPKISPAPPPPKPAERPPTHVGALRPLWLTSPRGPMALVLVRAAMIESKLVFQGILIDWPKLQAILTEEIQPILPDATLEPVRGASTITDRRMAALPVQLNPGPDPELPPAGGTPLRLGLALGWAAALLALAAVGFGGWSLIALSERRIRFVSAVTHELRTPLTSLRLYLDLLTSGMIREEDKQREYLLTMNAESERLNRLVDNVLDFARLENRSAAVNCTPLRLADLLADVARTWADRVATPDGRELLVHSALPPDQLVTTDVRMASQILGNLIDNARKYATGATDPRIWLRAKAGDRKRLYLDVEDRGPGVPVKERAGIFHPFRRGSAADTTAGGAGLGLALAKQWAEAIGGRLSYRVADGGVGACFRLELPIAASP